MGRRRERIGRTEMWQKKKEMGEGSVREHEEEEGYGRKEGRGDGDV